MVISESSLFCELTNEELEKLIKTSLNCELQQARLMLGGMFNTTYFIATQNGDYILSVGPVNRHLIMPFEKRCMETEVMIFELMRQNGVPASEVVYFDNSKSIIDRDFMIVKFIPSCMIYDIEKFYPGKKAQIMEQFGKAVKKFHSIKSPRFGRLQDVRDGKGFEKLSDFMNSEVEDWISVAKNTDFFDDTDFLNIRTVFKKFTEVFDEVKEASLVHGDIALTNALVHTSSDTPSLAAIIDPERGFWGDCEFDIAMTGYLIDQNFINGYGDIYNCDDHTTLRRKLYELLRRMFDCYVWGAEYNQPDNMAETRSFVRERTTELLNYKI